MNNLRMNNLKLKRYDLFFIMCGLMFFTSCNIKKSDSETAGGCSFASTGLTEATNYGTFDPNGAWQCSQYTSGTTIWSGMVSNVGVDFAPVAVPASLFGSGAACGQCYSVQGASSTIVARVIGECSGCTGRLDMDEVSFTKVTGIAPGFGVGSVTVTAIPCPVSGNVKIRTDLGSNPYYQKIAVADHVTPIQSVQIDIGSGFQSLTRAGTTSDFEGSLGASASTTAIVKVTDIFNQTVQGSYATAASSTTTIGAQFGTCQ